MKRKICPICDLPLNEMNYCIHCRKVIRRPVLWEVNYYLNEKRPDNQNQHDMRKSTEQKPTPPQTVPPARTTVQPNTSAAQPNRPAPPRTAPASRTATQPSKSVPPRTVTPSAPQQPSQTYIPSGSSEPNQKKHRKRFQVSIAGLATLFFIVAGAAPDVIKKAERLLDSNDSYDVAAPFDDSGFTQLTEDEVKAAGVACEGYDHFPVDGKSIADSMGQFLNENNYGYQRKPEEVYSDNYEFQGEDGSVSYYETFACYYLEDEKTRQQKPENPEDEYQFVEVNYDTGTGEVHEYISLMNHEEASLAYLEHFLKLTETAAQIPLEDSGISTIMEGVKAGLEQDNEADLMEGIFRVSVYKVEESVRVTVSYNNLQSTVNGEV